MPYGDRTGPMGLGPRSGGRRGRCWGADARRSWGGPCRRGPVLEERCTADETSPLNAKLAELEATITAIKGQMAALGKKNS